MADQWAPEERQRIRAAERAHVRHLMNRHLNRRLFVEAAALALLLIFMVIIR